MLKRYVRMTVATALCFCLFAGYVAGRIPDDVYITNGQLIIKSLPMVKFSQKGNTSRAVSRGDNGIKYTAKLFGVVPLKTVNATAAQSRVVSVAGTPFGIKMFSDGVMVVGFSDINGPCPARLAGLKEGDVITALDGQRVACNEDVENYIVKNGENPIKVSYIRSSVNCTATLTPVLYDGSYKSGMWVRDSSAGVGTMTFYDVEKGMFAGLGHGIKDVDTGLDIPLLSGEIVPVRITGITPSRNGQAGELKGSFISDFALGNILSNGTNGVYGTIFSPPADNLMEIADPSEIETGAAQVLCTVNGTKPKLYDIYIEKVNLTGSNHNKNMIIRITDSALLSQTGGIVQGQSGSPIIQNGKLIGAVTHVFVNQVNRGYAVFAQNMAESLDNAANTAQ